MKRLFIAVILCVVFAAAGAIQVSAQATNANGTVTCSYYSSRYNGRRTASGERFNNSRMTAASKTYPMGTRLRLTNVENGRTAVVVVNDRGPYVAGRDISVTRRAARELGFQRAGLGQVKVEAIAR